MDVLMVVVGAILQAMLTDSWSWMRKLVVDTVGRDDPTRTRTVGDELDRARRSLSGRAGNARSLVEDHVRGLLARQLLADPGLQARLRALYHTIQTERPALLASGAGRDNYVAGGNMTVYNATMPPADTFPSAEALAGMAAEEAARLLETTHPGTARDRLMMMETKPAVDRLAVMDRERAAHLLSFMDGDRAARLLKGLGTQVTQELLGLMLPSRAGIILQYGDPQRWVLDRLAALPPTRALAILAAIPQNRRMGFVHLMEHRQALTLLSAVGELVAENQLPFEEAQREAERILAKTRAEAAGIIAAAEETLTAAREQAARLLGEAEGGTAEPAGQPGPEQSQAPAGGRVADLREQILRFLVEHPRPHTPKDVANAIGHPHGEVATALAKLAATGEIDGGGRGVKTYHAK